MKTPTLILLFLSTIFIFQNCKSEKPQQIVEEIIDNEFSAISPQAISLLGNELISAEPSEELRLKWEAKKRAYEKSPQDADSIIWYGRFTAYMGGYKESIDIYSKGMEYHPEDARLYRHRGHRWISIREFDRAIEDLRKAESLIRGKENEIEPDGMPNARNIPVSSLHGNIYYHLGLAHYLAGNLEEANQAYQKCLATSRMPDNVVSASHWLFMINRLLDNEGQAYQFVKDISEEDDIIENHSYHQLCLLYNGIFEEEEAAKMSSSASANDAVRYGIANWHFYNGRQERGKELMEEIIEGDGNWASFGYIAAEADLARMSK